MSSVAVPVPAVRDAGGARCRGRARPAVYWWRRTGAVLLLVAAVFLLTVAVGRVGAEADLAEKVAGHVVVEPGQTLWDVAVATAPDGIDARRQLAELKALNGRSSSDVDAWTVVLVPAR